MLTMEEKTEKRFVQDRERKIQYLTLSRGVANKDLTGELAQYRAYKGTGIRVNALIRFDDDCKNGHCTLSITGSVSDGTKEGGACGQITELIEFVFPELRPFMKWHLTSTDGPMHYEANALYAAADRDAWGRRAGEPSSYSYGVRFNGVPVTHRIKSTKFYNFIKSRVGTGEFQLFPIAHEERTGDNYKFEPKYSLVGYEATKWHECPFDDRTEAEEFTEALNTCTIEFVEIPTAWSEGKKRELDHARHAAVWPDATDEELSVEPRELRAKLQERLPKLMEEFKRDVEALGFDYGFPAHTR
jgi:hypothetical protein